MSQEIRSFVAYTGDGATTDYTFAFPYLDRDHVYVTLNGVDTLDFTFATPSVIRLTSAAPSGTRVVIRRITPRADLITVISDNSVVRAEDLNDQALQTLYVAQESLDATLDVLSRDGIGLWDALGSRITNVGSPVDDTDAATKAFVETQTASSVTAAQNAASTALAAVTAAQAASADADGDRAAAEQALASALAALQAAETARDAAAASAASVDTTTFLHNINDRASSADVDAGLSSKWVPASVLKARLDGLDVPRLGYHIAGLKPDKLTSTVLRIQPGVVYNSSGTAVVSISSDYDIDMTTTGVGGLDQNSPTDNVDYFVYVLRRSSDGAFGAVLSASITYGGVVLPAGYTHVRKLRFGFVYRASRGGIPAFEAANWPNPFVRLTAAESTLDYSPYLGGKTGGIWKDDLNLTGWLPDNARIAHIIVTLQCPTGVAGHAYVRSPGAGTDTGIHIGSVEPGGMGVCCSLPIRVTSTRKLGIKTTGDVKAYVYVLGYEMTEPS